MNLGPGATFVTMHVCHCVVSENIHTPPTEVFFGLNPSIPLELYFPFSDPSPPHVIFNNPPWVGSGHFLEPHNWLRNTIFASYSQCIMWSIFSLSKWLNWWRFQALLSVLQLSVQRQPTSPSSAVLVVTPSPTFLSSLVWKDMPCLANAPGNKSTMLV